MQQTIGSQPTVVAYYGQRRAPTAYLSRLGCSLGKLQVVWPDKFCQAKQPEDNNLTSIYRQDMELFMKK